MAMVFSLLTNSFKDLVKVASPNARIRNELKKSHVLMSGIYMEEGQSEDERETADPKSTSVSSFQEDAEEDDENFMKLLDTLGGDRVFEE